MRDAKGAMLTMEKKLEEGIEDKIKVPKGRRDVIVFDTKTKGLFLRVFASGRAMYGVRYYVAGKARQKTLYDAGIKGALAKARKEAGDVRAKGRLGTDIVAEVKVATAAAKRKTVTLGDVATKYLKARKEELRPRSYLEVERHIDKHWKPLHFKPIEDITRADVVKVIDDLAEESGKVAADRARTALSTLFAWAIDRGYVQGTPVLHIKRRAGSVSRERALSETELVEVWRAAATRDDDYGRIIQLLILTGQRKGEIGSLGWAEIVESGGMGARVDLPGPRTKNGLPHLVPFSKRALACLPAKREENPMVFGRFKTGFTGWSKAKHELDDAITEARREADLKAKEMPHWVVHDLRRTFVTLIAELGFAQPHVVEALVNHVSGHKADVAGVYNKALYWEERCKALDAWGQYVEGLVSAPRWTASSLRASDS